MGFFGNSVEDISRLWCCLSDDNGCSMLDDTGLLKGNLLKCGTEELGVVISDVGDDGEDW